MPPHPLTALMHTAGGAIATIRMPAGAERRLRVDVEDPLAPVLVGGVADAARPA